MITEAVRVEAEKLRAREPRFWTYDRLALEFKVSAAAIYHALNPRRRDRRIDYRKRVADQHAAAESRRKGGVGPVTSHLKSNEREWRRQRALALPDTRDLTALFFGDPPPGRSALDQKRARDA